MLDPSVKLMSADDHLIEPRNLWVDRVPAKFRDTCPRIVEIDGREAWWFNDELVYITMASCRPLPGFDEAGYPPDGNGRFDEFRPGCYEPGERIKDMEIDGVWGQLLFPNYARFAGHRFFLNVKDHELGYACTRAYNDHLLEEWCASAPDRLYGAAILPLNDVSLAVQELERVVAKGAKALAFSENPTVLGLPSIHTDHWEPLWAAVNDAAIPVCLHIGSSSRLVTTSDDAPSPVQLSLNGLNSMMACVDWLMSGVLERHPRINVILSEGGAGWIPYLLERADRSLWGQHLEHGKHGKWEGHALPSQLFREHVYVCLVDEYFALRVLGDIPVDNLVWEGDYPHGDGGWPTNRTRLEKALADVSVEDATQIAETNLRTLLHAS